MFENWRQRVWPVVSKFLLENGLPCGVFILACWALFTITATMLDHAYTTDLPWLLQAGQFIIKHHYLPQTDLYSWTMPHKHWVLYQWLFEVIVAGLQNLVGLDILVRLCVPFIVLLYLGIPLWINGRRGVPLLLTILPCAVCLLIIPINISLRPMLVSVVMIAVQYILLHGYRIQHFSFRTLLICMAVLYCLWANMHTGIVMGYWCLTFMAVGDFLERQKIYHFTPNVPQIEGEPLALKPYLILIAIAFIASLINPYGWEIYYYLAHLTGQQYLNQAIIELQSPNFHGAPFQTFWILMLGLMLIMPKSRKCLSAQDILQLLIFTLLTLVVLRFVVWTCMLYALIFPKALYQLFAPYKDTGKAWVKGVLNFNLLMPFLGLITLIGTVVLIAFPTIFPKIRYAYCTQAQPAIAWYAQHRSPTDRLLDDSLVGSCMIGSHPEIPVFIDTRFDFYGGGLLAQQSLIFDGDPAWRHWMTVWQPNVVITQLDKPIVQLLEQAGSFREVYHDKNLVILRK